MKYFIDFEATQYSNEIISIGCVDKNGREFYSLVQPHKMEKLTDFITELTGITVQDLESAPTVNEAFSNFYNWLDKSKKVKFFVYGDGDKTFVKNTLKYATDFYAQCALGLIRSNLINFSKEVDSHFLINRDISLIKIVEYYRGEKIYQKHNALDDAHYLKEIYENMRNDVVNECPFPDYQIDTTAKKEKKKEINPKYIYKVEAVRGNISMTFPSYKKAADWVMQVLIPKNSVITDKTKSRVCNNIKNAIEHDTLYCGFKWYLHN